MKEILNIVLNKKFDNINHLKKVLFTGLNFLDNEYNKIITLEFIIGNETYMNYRVTINASNYEYFLEFLNLDIYNILYVKLFNRTLEYYNFLNKPYRITIPKLKKVKSLISYINKSTTYELTPDDNDKLFNLLFPVINPYSIEKINSYYTVKSLSIRSWIRPLDNVQYRITIEQDRYVCTISILYITTVTYRFYELPIEIKKFLLYNNTLEKQIIKEKCDDIKKL